MRAFQGQMSHLPGRLVAAIDDRARRMAGIHEYTDDPLCIFRLATRQLDHTVRLSEGTLLQPGEVVGTIHLAGERFPLLPEPGADLAWGKRLISQLVRSLYLLAAWAVSEEERQPPPRAYGNNLTLLYSSTALRVIRRVGFEVLEPTPPVGLANRAGDLGNRAWTYLLRMAHNPMSLTGLKLADLESRPVWITRRTLLERYRPETSPSPSPPATPSPT